MSDMLTRRMRTFSASPFLLKRFVLLNGICPACQAAKHVVAAGIPQHIF